MLVSFEIFGDVFGDKNVSSVAAIHHSLRHVDAGAGEVGATIHIYHPADRPAVHAHSNLQAWMCLERAADFNRALRRRFRTGVKNQGHAIAGWNFYQSTGVSAFEIDPWPRTIVVQLAQHAHAAR